ncbi:MAG: phosphoglycerate dehydrogenase [Gammaproteobacteria bacterium]|jgi:D-3-phosphoglycerate dehydrogenase
MKIIITDSIDQAAIDLLTSCEHEVEQIDNADEPAIIEALEEASGWIIRSGTQITAKLLAHARKLVVIGRAGVGVDNIDIGEATRLGIAVVNTPTGNTLAAVEHTMALLLALARNIPQAHGSLMVDQTWERKAFTGVELYGKTIGIAGLGKIGSRVAGRCRAFEMQVLAYDPYISAERAAALDVELMDDLDALLAKSDFISLHMPNTSQTRNLMNAERLKNTKPGARIINCARGNLIDEVALADALRSGHIAGAALDVFQEEPPFDSPLMQAPNIIITPHLGASTQESQRNVGVQVAQQVSDAVCYGVFKDAVNIPVRDWATYEKLTPFLNMVERMGALAAQYAESGIKRIEVDYAGGPFEEFPALNNTLLKGLLTPVLGDSVNAVNASVLASERGIELSHSQSAEAAGYKNLISVIIHTANGQRSFAATTFADQLPRLVMLDGCDVDVYLEGMLLIFSNMDHPGVIGDVGQLLGENQINIAHFSLGRRHPGGEALAIVAVDDLIEENVLSKLGKLRNMKWARVISLDQH